MRCVKISLFFLLVFCSHFTIAQNNVWLRGYVLDEETEEPLPGANVLLTENAKGTSSRADGFFELSVPAHQDLQIRFSSIGYEEYLFQTKLSADKELKVRLSPAAYTTEEVVIQADKYESPQEQLIDRISLNTEDIQSVPQLMGEADPVKVVQMLPGVQSAGEGNTGFYVRGGGLDQNLILLDKATVYNASHLFGFFSVFNGNIVDEVSLDKGGIPASYGGRLSSVLNIKSKSGSKDKWQGKANLGLISANIQLEGPIVKDKSSLMISGRRTYYDVLQKSLLEKTAILKSGLDYYFYDLNLKWDYLISSKDKLSLSAYTGNDQFEYANFGAFSNKIKWGNKAFSLQWQHAFSPQWLSETTAFGSQYQMNLGAEVSGYHIQISSDVVEKGLQQEFVYSPSESQSLSMGFRLAQYQFVPGAMQASSANQPLNFGEVQSLQAREGAVFVHYQKQLSEKLNIGAGLRVSMFQHLGPFQRYVSDDHGRHQDTLLYQNNQVIAQHSALEPRASVSYEVSSKSAVRASYDHMVQYIHMAPMSSVSLPTDVWVPSSSLIKPQRANQLALGYSRTLYASEIKTSLTAYYKHMAQQLEYQNGVLLGKGQYQNFDDKFYVGQGNSYGLEWLIRKEKGIWNGWLSYTLSRTDRKFKDINQGVRFPAKYDRLHNLSLLINYRRPSKWHFSGVFALASGNTMTLPVARYIMQGNIVNEYAGRNNFRLPVYHRLDLSATYYPLSSGKIKSYWVFSLYNIYSRMNPYYVYFEAEGSLRDYTLDINARQVSLFPVIPSISYHIKF